LSTACPSPNGSELGNPVRDLAVGDAVVYAAYGVGCVVARKPMRLLGVDRECLVVELAAGLRVTLPLDAAAERLRAVANDADVAVVAETLGQQPADRIGPWTKRIKESKAKLARGSTADLAELVRDGVRYDHRVDGPRLSPVERRVYLQARELLIREVASAKSLEHADAETWVQAQIAPAEQSAG
jgi:RNA polymerase-interacting CarD/CdnL/TRCF family regulator